MPGAPAIADMTGADLAGDGLAEGRRTAVPSADATSDNKHSVSFVPERNLFRRKNIRKNVLLIRSVAANLYHISDHFGFFGTRYAVITYGDFYINQLRYTRNPKG